MAIKSRLRTFAFAALFYAGSAVLLVASLSSLIAGFVTLAQAVPMIGLAGFLMRMHKHRRPQSFEHRKTLITVAVTVYAAACVGGALLSDRRQQPCLNATLSPEQTIAACDGAIQRQPGAARLYLRRAGANLRLERASPALADSDEALKLQPRNTAALVLRGLAELHLGQFTSALGDLDLALRSPQAAPQLTVLAGEAKASALIALDRDGDATDAIDAVLRTDAASEPALLARALIAMNAGDMPAAVRTLGAIRPDDRTASASMMLGIARFYDTGPASAVVDFAHARSASKAPDDAALAQAWILLARGPGGQDGAAPPPLGLPPGDAWPRALLDLFAGAATPDEALLAAKADGGTAERSCEAEFFVGAFEASRHEADAARRHLRQAASLCRRDDATFAAARAALGRLE